MQMMRKYCNQMVEKKNVATNALLNGVPLTVAVPLLLLLLSSSMLLFMGSTTSTTTRTPKTGMFVQSFSPTSLYQSSRTNEGARPFNTVGIEHNNQQKEIVFSKTKESSRTSTVLYATTIVEEVTDEMKKAMRAKDTITLNTIRLIRSAFANAAIELRTEQLQNEDAITVLKKLAKMRKESIDMFEKGGAMDRAELERNELLIIERWLPQLADETTTRQWILEAIEEVGKENMGKVMGALMKKHKSDIDGNLAQRILKEELAK